MNIENMLGKIEYALSSLKSHLTSIVFELFSPEEFYKNPWPLLYFLCIVSLLTLTYFDVISANLKVRAAISVFVALLTITIAVFPTLRGKFKSQRLAISKVKGMFIQIINFLSNNFQIRLSRGNEIMQTLEQSIDVNNSYSDIEIIDSVFGLIDNRLGSRVYQVLFLIYISNNLRSTLEKTSYRAAIKGVIEIYKLMEKEQDKNLLITQYKKIFHSSEKDDIILREIFRNYDLSEYLRTEFGEPTFEEISKTLLELVTDSELSVDPLYRILKKKINNTLSTTTRDSQLYIVFANQFQRIATVKAYLSNHSIINGPKQENLTQLKGSWLSGNVLYSPTIHPTAKSYFTHEIMPLLAKEDNLEEKPGFLVTLKVRLENYYTFVNKKAEKEQITSNLIMLQNFIGSLAPGKESGSNFIFSLINIQEIMSVIPFNVFIPNLRKEARNIIIRDYSKLRSRFNIRTLGDWALVPSVDLYRNLVRLDKYKLIENEEWRVIATKITEQSRKYQDILKLK